MAAALEAALADLAAAVARAAEARTARLAADARAAEARTARLAADAAEARTARLVAEASAEAAAGQLRQARRGWRHWRRRHAAIVDCSARGA